MPHDFWDTSAAAKLYLNEQGSEWAIARARQFPVAVSRLVIPELASVLARRFAEGTLGPELRDVIYERFLTDTKNFSLIRMTDELLSDAGRVLREGPFGTRVRAADGIHLATAQWWFEQAERLNIEPGAFVVADRPLREAAVALGLAVENPEDYA